MSCLALDIGGANVKFSDGLERTGSIPLALWKSPDQLAGLLRTIVGSAAECTAVGVTMPPWPGMDEAEFVAGPWQAG